MLRRCSFSYIQEPQFILRLMAGFVSRVRRVVVPISLRMGSAMSTSASREFSTGPNGEGKVIRGVYLGCMDANTDPAAELFPNHHKLRYGGGALPPRGTCPQVDSSIKVATTDNLGLDLASKQRMVISTHSFCKATRMELQGLTDDSMLRRAQEQIGIYNKLSFEDAIKRADEVARQAVLLSFENAIGYGFEEQNLQGFFFNPFTALPEEMLLVFNRKTGNFEPMTELQARLAKDGAEGFTQQTGVDSELIITLLGLYSRAALVPHTHTK